MRFLLDQDVYRMTACLLRDLGHDVVSAAQFGLAQADDSTLLRVAREQNRIFVTRDRDFGGLVFSGDIRVGVIYLRVLPTTLNAVHAELRQVLLMHDEDELKSTFVVIEPGRHRIRSLPRS